MSTVSASLSKLSITPSLSDTLAPPSTTTNGRSGDSVRRLSTSISAWTSPPMACGSRCATSYTLACLRCTTPNPSLTKTSAREASSSAKAPRTASSLDVSPTLNRRFSSSATCPSASPATVDRADSPTVSVAKATGAPRSSWSRWATGAREYLASGAPLGLPRWAHTTTRAPASLRALMVGNEARTRPSSVMVVSASCGTFRSQRTKTRLPRRSPAAIRSSAVFIGYSERLADVRDQVDEAAGVAPLVVVPADDLGHVAVDVGQAGVEDARCRVGDDVRRDDRVLGVGQDPLQRALGRSLDGGVDLFLGGRGLQLDGQVGGRPRRQRHAHRVAVELALELRHDQGDGLGCSGRGRDHVQGSGASAAQVLVRVVEDVLVIGVGVDRRHQATLDAERVVDDLGHRRQAVRGARGVGDDVVRRWVVVQVVDAHDDGEVLALCRRGDDDLLGACGEVLAGAGRVGEEAGRLDDDVGAHLGPREVRRVALGEDREAALASDGDLAFACDDVLAESAEDAVVLKQVREGLRVRQVVDAHHLDVGATGQQGPVEVAADAAKAIDSNANSHVLALLRLPKQHCLACLDRDVGAA